MRLGNYEVVLLKNSVGFIYVGEDMENKPMKIKRKISQKNRLQIPIQIMNELNIKEGDIVLVDIKDNKIIIEKEETKNV